MKYFILSIAATLFFACVSLAQSKDSARRCAGFDKKVAALIGQYQELRERRRQLPEGNYDRDLRDHRGKLHRVLSLLGAELGRPPYTKEMIVNCLGEPDAMRNGRQMNRFLEIYHRELRKAGRKIEERNDREYLVYFWRGWHDFIFFISKGGIIVDHGWWFAYE